MWAMVISVLVMISGVPKPVETTRLWFDTGPACASAIDRMDMDLIERDYVLRHKHTPKRRRVSRVTIACAAPPAVYTPRCSANELWCHVRVNHA